MKLEFDISGGDFASAGKASSRIKKVLKQLQVDPRTIKRIVVAVYEAEVNIVAHSVGGKLTVQISGDSIWVEANDKGPGIENVEQAMQSGFSTASKKVREMGFGAGMGLPNIKKNTDEFTIESQEGKGTLLVFSISI